MLLRALALVVGASASAEINCTFAPNECPGVSWDLTPLQQLTHSADLEVAAAAGEVPDEHFWLGVCRSPIEAGQCETLSNISDPAGLQVWRSEAGGEECAPLGSLSTAAWSMASPGNEAEGVLLSFSGGAAGRSMVVRFVCDKSIPKAVLTEATGGSLKYNLTVRAAAACPVGRCTASAGTRHTFATLLAEQEEIRLLYFEQRAKTYIEEVLVPALGISVFYYVMEFAWARRFRDQGAAGRGQIHFHLLLGWLESGEPHHIISVGNSRDSVVVTPLE